MSNWYVSESDSWYAPLRQDAPAEETKNQNKKGRVWLKVLFGAALLIGLIVGSALLFPNKSAEPEQNGSGGSNFGQFILPPAEDEDETMPDDYRDFFDNFYTVIENERSSTGIRKTKLERDFAVQLEPAGEELTLKEIYRRGSQSIVAISSYTNGKAGYSWGTGIILSEDGLILTNAHIIEDGDRAAVTLGDDKVYDAKLVGVDFISDIAVLKIEATGLPPAVFGDSSTLEVGDRVAAIGNPLGEEFRLTLTDGIISGIERGVNYNGRSMNLLQTNTAINEGNSGGPLFNMSGQVIGITNMKMMSSYSSIEGIGFAIPSATAAKIVNALIRDGEVTGRPSIGVTVGAIPDSAREHYGDKLPASGGLYVSGVAEGSDALEQGIRRGDIILKADGVEVSTTAQLSGMKDKLAVGDTMRFTIWRDGEILEIDVKLVDTNDIYG